MSSTLILPGDELPMIEPEEMRDRIGQQLDLIIDGGHCGFEPSTVIDLSGDLPTVIREGRGEVPNLE
jgi:tRNA A37 threonylcarbamoyladenosine synthetase subunit TsaC/SUA5/YrdC